MTFGRTNREFPDIWLSLHEPDRPADFELLAREASATGLPLDVSHGASVWGAHLRGSTNPLVAFLTFDLAKATSHDHACDLVAAEVVQFAACLRRPLTFLFLPDNATASPELWDGALQAVDSARTDGLVEFAGLSCLPGRDALRGVWPSRDAFEALCVHDPGTLEAVSPLAIDRRVGLVTTFESGHTRLVPVRHVRNVRQVRLSAATAP